MLAMVVLGGIGHIPGRGARRGAAVALSRGAAAHGRAGAECAVRPVFVDAEVLRMMLYGLAMVLIMLYRPGGLWPAPEHGVGRAPAPPAASRARDGRHPARGQRRQQALRRPAGAVRRRHHDRARPDLRADRPNGAGKTTFFNVITGLYTPDSGTFELDGKPYSPTEVHKVAQAGIARTFQNIRLFPDMTALENVMVGRHVRTQPRRLGAVLRTQGDARGGSGNPRSARMELLEYVGIAQLRGLPGAHPLLRRPAPPRDRARAGHRSQAAGAGRAGGRHERHREGRAARAAVERSAATA